VCAGTFSRLTQIIKIEDTQISLNVAGRVLRSTSNQSSEPCEVAQHPLHTCVYICEACPDTIVGETTLHDVSFFVSKRFVCIVCVRVSICEYLCVRVYVCVDRYVDCTCRHLDSQIPDRQ